MLIFENKTRCKTFGRAVQVSAAAQGVKKPRVGEVCGFLCSLVKRHRRVPSAAPPGHPVRALDVPHRCSRALKGSQTLEAAILSAAHDTVTAFTREFHRFMKPLVFLVSLL